MIPALIAGTPRRQAKERALHLLELMGLEDRRDHKPAELSGGEKQRVAVARALVNDPDVILADEPSGSLDTKNKTELHSLFFNLRDKLGQTFVIVTHDETLAALTDRTIHMRDGQIVTDCEQPQAAETPQDMPVVETAAEGEENQEEDREEDREESREKDRENTITETEQTA